MKAITIHLLPNAHLDPVWLWDAREGLNEGITTCRTILELMHEFPELTFIRGEAAIYQHIQNHDPVTFQRIVDMVRAGRWDIVGGNYIQPDTNLPSTEALARQFLHGKTYFWKTFRRQVTAAWAADSFGHSAGLPEILHAAGMESFACTRPMPAEFPMPSPAFWWEGSGGSRVLVWRPTQGWYGCERFDLKPRLDQCLEEARRFGVGIGACLFGLGNHGGGPSREHLLEIRQWAEENPGVRLIYSGLHQFFGQLQRSIKTTRHNLPVHRGELNFCLRGCYVSLAKIKFPYRRAERAVLRAESANAAVQVAGMIPAKSHPLLETAWQDVLFNGFHDILPGSCIERAADEQIESLGRALHNAREVEFDALMALASKVQVNLPKPPKGYPTAVAFLVWNPNSHPYEGAVELEAGIDYRPHLQLKHRDSEIITELRGPDGKRIAHQQISNEHRAIHDYPWRKRVVFHTRIPAMGWGIYTLGWVGLGAPQKRKANSIKAVGVHGITNGNFSIYAKPGATGIRITCKGQSLFKNEGFGAATYEDPWGSWGGILEEPESLDLQAVRTRWVVSHSKVLESGPERACLWVLLEGGNSKMHLHFYLSKKFTSIEADARLLWIERSARLKLLMPCSADEAEFDVPGGKVFRGTSGEVPGGAWVRAYRQGSPAFSFASDAIYGFNLNRKGTLEASIVRSGRYADDYVLGETENPEIPCADAGEFKFRFLLAPGDANIQKLSDELSAPLETLLVWPHTGTLPSTGSLLHLEPSTLRLLAWKRAEEGRAFVLRVMATGSKNSNGRLVLGGQTIELGRLEPGKIVTWRIAQRSGRWVAARSSLIESTSSLKLP